MPFLSAPTPLTARPPVTTALLLAGLLAATACSQAREPAAAATSPTPATAATDASTAPEATAASAAGKDRPEVIRAIERQGMEIHGQFDAPGGLRGYAGLAGQRPMAVYVTPDGGHAVVGILLDAKGQDIGAAALQRLVEEPVSKRTWAQLEKSHWVGDGKADAPRVVYAFSDANCPFCHRFWQAARPWVDAGKVQLRHVLVGVIREDSANKAAAILTAPSPEQALAHNETHYDRGGITGTATVPAAVRKQLDDNERLMLELGFQGTPGILFRDERGMIQRRSGLPSPQDLATVLGPR